MTAAPSSGIALHPPVGRRAEAVDRDRRVPVTRHLPLAFGCLALVMAALLPAYVYPRVAVLPDDPQQEQVQTATGATVLVPDVESPAGAKVVQGADVRISTFVSAVPGESGAESVVWRLATSVTVKGHGMINARVETVSLDPHTAKPTNCCDDRLVTSKEKPIGDPINHRGYVAWPFNVQKRSYPIWDVVLNRSRTASFIGEEQRDGLRTYRFRATTPFEKVGTMELPGRLFGLNVPGVIADTEYADTRTYWIEPVTGNVIDMREDLQQQYTYQGRTVTAMAASLESPPLSDELMDKTKQGIAVLPWLRSRASYVLVLVGLGLLAFWGWNMRRRRPDTPSTSTARHADAPSET